MKWKWWGPRHVRRPWILDISMDCCLCGLVRSPLSRFLAMSIYPSFDPSLGMLWPNTSKGHAGSIWNEYRRQFENKYLQIDLYYYLRIVYNEYNVSINRILGKVQTAFTPSLLSLFVFQYYSIDHIECKLIKYRQSRDCDSLLNQNRIRIRIRNSISCFRILIFKVI